MPNAGPRPEDAPEAWGVYRYRSGATFLRADSSPRMIEESAAKPKSSRKAEMPAGIELANFAQKGESC